MNTTATAAATTLPPPRAVAALADTLRLAGDATRLRILFLLADGERNVTDLCRLVGDMAQPALSHHLKLLSLSGVVEPARRGKFIDYSLTAKGRLLYVAIKAFGAGTEGAR